MPNVRITNMVAATGIKNTFPNVRVSSFQTGELVSAVVNSIDVGMPVGLLLALTYSADFDVTVPATYRGDYRPTVRITTD